MKWTDLEKAKSAVKDMDSLEANILCCWMEKYS